MKNLQIIESFSNCGVNVRRIVNRVLAKAPEGCTDGLKQIKILDSDPEGRGFACYLRKEREIRLFVKELIGWQPWILKKTFIFPYLIVGIALAHEIDHHVNRNNFKINKEESAERNAFKYLYPSLGIFKPLIRTIWHLKTILSTPKSSKDI